MYDPSSVLLIPLAFLAMVKGRMRVYYLLFILAVLNKETSLLLIGFFAIYHWQNKPIKQLVLQALIYVGLTGWLRWMYADNAGGTVETHGMDNLHFLATPSIVLLTTWLKLGALAIVVGAHWKQREKVLRRCLILALVLVVPLWALFGRLAEIRGFLEGYFLFFLLAYPNLSAWLSSRSADSSPSEGYRA
jgi:hypothetical protein